MNGSTTTIQPEPCFVPGVKDASWASAQGFQQPVQVAGVIASLTTAAAGRRRLPDS